MTLMTDNKPAAGGQPPAPATPNASPSSGDTAQKGGEQPAAGKEPAKTGTPPAEPAKAKDDKAGSKPSGAPVDYSFKTPEGGKELNKDVTTAFSSVARELNLSNEAAQQILDKMSPALAAQTKADVESMVAGWVKETNDDPVIGGDKLNETLSYAQRALALTPPELRQLLGPLSEGGTGLGNHKAVIAGFAAIGRKLSPDSKVVSGNEPAPPKKDALQRLADSYETSKD